VKFTIPIAASAVILSLALAGCSSGGLPGTAIGAGSGGSGGSGGSASGPTKNYSANDLVTILQTAQKAQGLSGTVQDNTQLKKLQASGGSKSFTQEFAASGGTFSPASCGTKLDSLVALGEQLFDKKEWIGASLNASTDILDVAATSNTAATGALFQRTKSIMANIAAQCPTMVIRDAGISIGFTIKAITATTNGDNTYGYEEDISESGTTTKTITVEASYGNLYVGDVSITDADLTKVEANVNAVIAAAK
jgi:hypothetical protein